MAGSKAAPAGRFEALKVSPLPSMSVADTVNSSAAASSAVWLPIAARTGGALTWFTVMVIASESEAVPSLTVKVTPV